MATIYAVPIGQIHYFRCTLIHRETREEKLVDVRVMGDRFCNVLAVINQRFPGWAVFESWEFVPAQTVENN